MPSSPRARARVSSTGPRAAAREKPPIFCPPLGGPTDGQAPEIPSASAAVRPEPAPVPAVAAPPAPAPAPLHREIAGVLGEGSSLLGVLQASGLPREALFELLDAAGKVIDFR